MSNKGILEQAGYNNVNNVRGYAGTNAFGREGSLEVRCKSGFKLPLPS